MYEKITFIILGAAIGKLFDLYIQRRKVSSFQAAILEELEDIKYRLLLICRSYERSIQIYALNGIDQGVPLKLSNPLFKKHYSDIAIKLGASQRKSLSLIDSCVESVNSGIDRVEEAQSYTIENLSDGGMKSWGNLLKAQDLYDLSNITTIELTFADPNWDATLDSYYSSGLDQRLIGTCLVNGIQYDSVGVKYKGNSTYSANNAKNPINIKLNHIINNQDYDDFYTLKLSNGKNDPSFVREVLSYEIARKYMNAPLSNYAKVTINGNFHGIYSSSESVNKKFVKEKFYSNKNNTLFKCNPANTMNGGSSLEYLGMDSSLYFNFYELQTDYGWNDIAYYTNELNNNFSNIETTWDIDRAIWMLAFDNVLVSLDTYIGPFKQNYYLFKDNHDRFNSIVWDMNESLGGFEMVDMSGGGFSGVGNQVTSIVSE